MSASIEDLEIRVADCRRQLRAAEADLTAARIASYPYKVGDIVEALVGGTWKRAIIRDVEAMSWAPWYKASGQNKDGQWSNRSVRVFDNVRPDPLA